MKIDELTISKEALQLGQSLMVGANSIALRDIPETSAGDELFAYLLFKHCHGCGPSKECFSTTLYID
jgi:hypothetical protein